jgi:uncharacterized protein YuzB (UPF0349 family)
MIEIKFCENNFTNGTDVVMSKLKEEFDNADISSESCLGYCGDCAMGPFALVNDELVQADSADELYEEIKNIIE